MLALREFANFIIMNMTRLDSVWACWLSLLQVQSIWTPEKLLCSSLCEVRAQEFYVTTTVEGRRVSRF